jgi:hypothetical protein
VLEKQGKKGTFGYRSPGIVPECCLSILLILNIDGSHNHVAALTSGLDIAILGKKGRGKSYAAKGLVERVLVLDPLGHWWGLKVSANGEQVVSRA